MGKHGKFNKKKGGGGKKKHKHSQYYDIFDAAQDMIEDKVDNVAKDVSYLDRDAPMDVPMEEETQPAEPEGFQEEEVFEEKWTSPYESLLQTLRVGSGEDKKRGLKKRKLDTSAASGSAAAASEEPATKKQKVSESSKAANTDSGDVDGDEIVDEDEDEEDPEEYERMLHEKRLQDKLRDDARGDEDGTNTVADEEDDEKALGGYDAAEDVQGDPFDAHLDPVISQKDIEARTSRQMTELASHDAIGRIWSDTADGVPAAKQSSNYHMKPRVVPRWNAFFDEVIDITSKRARKRERRRLKAMATAEGADSIFNIKVNEQQHVLLSCMTEYYDMMYCARTHENAVSTMSAYTAHALNHVLKTRDRILKHNNALHVAAQERQQQKQQKKKKEKPAVEDEAVEYRDQGFTRPKVLVILPMRNACLEFVDMLLQLAPKTQADRVANKRKFNEEFFDESYSPKSQKPLDYLATFRGNTDDSFRIGISFSKKYIKLYSEFYSSDILVASPLGLRLAIEDSQKGNFDFLSSIEVVIVDQCEALMMQNWDHLEFIFQRLNQLPKKPRDTDFSRVRQWYLDDHMKYYRQTLFFSQFSHVDINSLQNRYCSNIRGRVRITEDFRSSQAASLSLVTRKLRQVFHRVQCDTLADVDDARFEYFSSQIYNHIKGSLSKGTFIFVPTYFDFVRLKAFLKKKADEEAEEFVVSFVSEYTKTPDVSRARTRLVKGQVDVMLYSERFHFYHRYLFKGIKNVVFYAPPQFYNFYPEIVNLMADDGTCLTLFTKFDVYQLEPVVGSKRCERMLTSDKATFLFC